MTDVSSKPSSLKDYLKKYTSNADDKKKKKRKVKKSKHVAAGVLIVDNDPIWQKHVNLEEEEEEDLADEEKPQVDEDIDVKRMKRLELLKVRRPFGAISEDGSGWVSVSDNTKTEKQNYDTSPPSNRRPPSPKPVQGLSGMEDVDVVHSSEKRARYDSPSPEPYVAASDTNEIKDMSPPRRKQRNKSASSPEPRRNFSSSMATDSDISPPRRTRNESKFLNNAQVSSLKDLSPPRKIKTGRTDSLDVSARKSRHNSDSVNVDLGTSVSDLSPPRRKLKDSPVLMDRPRTGIVSRSDLKEDNDRRKKEDILRFEHMDPSMSGRGAAAVYRDKKTGKRMTEEEFIKLKDDRKKEVKPKEIKLEWGKGLAQKREAEAKLEELEVEKNKPFARSRDDPDLDTMLKERVRWGDPMAHLVKRKSFAPILPDLGDNERMKESGFIIPQEIPSHSWIKRGLDAAPNRYGIKPGRHWDGVDRSNGYEKEMFKRSNERRASEQEAYLWSVSDM